ncbi:Sensor protein kinase WalK [Planococcus massiliensis]|uniref:histidine kinase n=1 Tax=Planococcus massiliensis TaxID=1499687 RepID=A0A098EGX0_9BACL|nr:HAMP domain-containing sensor histidine kinase [Planococcus massiliensis]CEG21544.1 Sensor protein kinase WalK [Planococcus massiliensis]
MNLHKRFMVQFFIQLFLLSFVFLLLMLTLWGAIGYFVTEDEAARDLADADSSYFMNQFEFDENGASIKKGLKKTAEAQDGWLILLNRDGRVLDSFNADGNLPEQLAVEEVASWMWDDSAEGQYTYWELENTERGSLFLLYGKENLAAKWLASAEPAIDWEKGELNLAADLKTQLKEKTAWVLLIGKDGIVLDSYGDVREQESYTIKKIGELAADTRSAAIKTDPATGKSVIAGAVAPPSDALETILKTRNFYIVIVVLLILLIGGTLWYARKFGVPLLVMMQWIKNLGDGRYEQPVNQKNESLITKRNGKVKKKYRLYKDLVATLEQLTAKLKLHQHQQKQLERTREDWISGLSHDLKTPLSSISGYAQMLESPDYEWSAQEIREFAAIMNDKSTYMMDLLEELTLTFRLKNQALPLSKETVNLNEFVRRIVIQFINDPANGNWKFSFHAASDSVEAAVDPKWFQRIIENLIVNAMKYNPPGTEIKLSISAIEQHLAVIIIEDDGVGMKAEVLDKLFDRYYRGTNTEDSSTGTGLGLAITKQLVQLHGGSIQVASTIEKGTSVRVIVPI